MTSIVKPVLSSFRDPSAQVYSIDDVIYRQINENAYEQYRHLMNSGLYQRLIALDYLVPHKEVDLRFAQNASARVVIQPEKIQFISYPYEWCFSQLKDAATLTLEITKIALEYGMILKDASAYNVQFQNGKPLFIDTNSFEIYQTGHPWMAYSQFCRHFLAPLVLMTEVDASLSRMLALNVNGISLELASKLLPLKTWFSFSILAHIHIHAKSQKKYSDRSHVGLKKMQITRIGLLGLLDNLSSVITGLKQRNVKTEWGNYYNQTNYSTTASSHKVNVIQKLIKTANPKKIWDLGANNGFYSQIGASLGAYVVSFDIDPVAVEANYQNIKKNRIQHILPLIQDLTNPSASIGWAHLERDSLAERSSVDLVMALALIHHLAISNNIPLARIADYFSGLGDYLIIEFVPKEDSQVQRLLASRDDIFEEYNFDGFKKSFLLYFNILEEISINETCRRIYLMKKK